MMLWQTSDTHKTLPCLQWVHFGSLVAKQLVFQHGDAEVWSVSWKVPPGAEGQVQRPDGGLQDQAGPQVSLLSSCPQAAQVLPGHRPHLQAAGDQWLLSKMNRRARVKTVELIISISERSSIQFFKIQFWTYFSSTL